MELQAFGWNCVVVGRWNPAILTPAGITERVFKLSNKENVEVLVPLDGIAPYLVKHPEKPIQVSTHDARLFVNVLQDFSPAYLEDCLAFARNAISSLPETPFAAAGYNLKFRATSFDAQAAQLLGADRVDSAVSEANLSIASRVVLRVLERDPGVLNLALQGNGARGIEVSFNFHCESSNRDTLIQWLTPRSDETFGIIERLFRELGLPIPEGIHVGIDNR